MKPEEIAAILKEIGYQQLVEVFASVDPQLYEIFRLTEMVKGHGYGEVKVIVADKKIKLIYQTFNHTPIT